MINGWSITKVRHYGPGFRVSKKHVSRESIPCSGIFVLGNCIELPASWETLEGIEGRWSDILNLDQSSSLDHLSRVLLFSAFFLPGL